MSSQIKRQSEGSFFKEPRQFGQRFPNGFPIGKRTEERAKQNRELSKLPDAVKRHCEIRLQGCLGNKYLSWAHSQKSRYLTTDRDWQEAARSCAFCHGVVEAMSHKEMRRIICEAIKRRKV